jgi:hypothetical protein
VDTAVRLFAAAISDVARHEPEVRAEAEAADALTGVEAAG